MTARTEIRMRRIRRRTRQYRLWYLDDKLYYGVYASFTQKAVIKADETAYTIAADRWPSGLEQIVFLQDEDAPTFHASSNGTDFTYHTAEQLGLEWNDGTARAVNDYLTALRINPFTDVASSDYFFQAVLWAVERGITTGTGNTTFSPDMACTRAQIVTFLYRRLN